MSALVLAFFPTPFSGEAAQYELGMHRLPRMVSGRWDDAWVELAPADPGGSAAGVASARPDLVVLHAHRTQVADAIAFANALGSLAPDLPLVLCGWPAHPPYVDGVAAATTALTSPSLALACGEVEAVLPAVLARAERSGARAADLAGVRGVVLWDPGARRWRGSQTYQTVEQLDELPEAWIEHIPKEWHDGEAGWLELSRGCKYRCSFCLACAFERPRVRRFGPERILGAVRTAAERGVDVLGLLSASNSFDVELLRSVVGAFHELKVDRMRVAGPVHARYVRGEALELLSALRWDLMTIGLQTVTPEAQRLIRRGDEPEAFARTMERIAAFATPEIEIILGLPGDSPEGFVRTVRFLLGLPVKITVHTLRLDPWSSFLLERDELGLEVDFAEVARVRASPSFAAEDMESCRAWLRELGRGPWSHRASHLALDGEQLDGADDRRGD